MKILLALGSDPNAAPIALSLVHRGWQVITDPQGEDAAQHVANGGFDAALLEPNLDGLHKLIERLRLAEPDLAIVLLGEEVDLRKKEQLFDVGADDVLAHPIHAAEIDIRARAIARRRHGHLGNAIRFGDLLVIPCQHASWRGERLPLQRMQFRVLEYLAQRAGRIVSRETLLNALYGTPDEPDAKVIDVFLCKLRAVLTSYGAPEHLVGTVWGRGYTMPLPYAAGAPMPDSGVDCKRRVSRGVSPRRCVGERAA